MLIDTYMTIAYKCFSCGSYEFFDISLFTLPEKRKELQLKCRCNKYGAAILRDRQGRYAIRIDCMACGKKHIFTIGRREMLHGRVNMFNCPETGIQQCFVGNGHEVRKKIDSIEKELDEFIDMLGYESYFKNTRVAFDSLNRIHDIAEKGNLYCGCGSRDIELEMLTEKILLKCRKCSRSIEIKIASNEDLKNLLSSKQILLGYEKDKAGTKGEYNL